MSSHDLIVSTSGPTKPRPSTSASRRGGKAPCYHHGDLRAACIRAGLELVAAGELGFSMRDLARRIGVSHQAPYHHFAGREDLLAAIRAEGFVEFLADLCRARQEGSSPRDALHRLGRAYLEFARRRPHHYRLMFSVPASSSISDESCTPDTAGSPTTSGGGPMMPSAAEASFEELHGCIRDLQAAGDYPGRLSLDVAVAVWAWSHGLALLLSQGQLRWLGYGDRLTADLYRRWAALLPEATEAAGRRQAMPTSPGNPSTRRSRASQPGFKASSRGRSSPSATAGRPG